MLLRLEITNFFSIKEKQVFDLTIPQTSPDDLGRFAVLGDTGIRVPKVVALFGANASGKTTVLRAITYLVDFVRDSFTDNKVGAGTDFQCFASDEGEASVTELCMEFVPATPPDLPEHPRPIIYRYELKIQNDGLNNHVIWEALRWSHTGKRFKLIFQREENEGGAVVKTSPDFGISGKDPRLSVRNNVSVISSLNQFGHKQSLRISEEFSYSFHANMFSEKFRSNEKDVSGIYKRSPIALQRLNRVISTLDLGIERIEIEELDSGPYPFFFHKGHSRPSPFHFESQGTKNFYCLFPRLDLALVAGGTAAMDEIDSDIHPLIMPEIIRWFHDLEMNEEDGQLIMTCHNASLLEHLVKEEVWFTEKNEAGETSLYPLRHISGVRRDTNIYAKYISGAFGAVPQIG